MYWESSRAALELPRVPVNCMGTDVVYSAAPLISGSRSQIAACRFPAAGSRKGPALSAQRLRKQARAESVNAICLGFNIALDLSSLTILYLSSAKFAVP